MLKQGLVLLSDEDADAPPLPAVATVSKDDAWDHGAYDIGAADAALGKLWVDRPYFTGNPSVDWMVAKCDRVTDAGGYAQLGNEANLTDVEHWIGGPAAWDDFYWAVFDRVKAPERLLAMPPSPGLPGWEEWVTPVGGGPHAVHAYGTVDQMRGIVEWYIANTSGDLFVTECNFGAGNEVSVDRWADDHLVPFLDWLATQPRVRFCSYFAWRWRGAPPMPTTVDAAGTRVEAVLRAWRPPEEPMATTKGIDISNHQGTVDFAAVKAAGYAFAAIKSSGDEGAADAFLDPLFPENWHAARGQGFARLAYHYARPSRVSPAASVTTLQRALQAVGGLTPGDNVALDLEDPGVADGTSLHAWCAEWLALAEQVFGVRAFKYSARYYTRTHDLEHADLARWPTWWASWQAIMPAPVTGWAPIAIWQNSASATVPGVAGDCDTDVFVGTVDELRALGLPGAPEPPAGFDVEAARGALWATADELEANGWPWFAAGVKSAVAQSKGEH